MQFKSDSRRSLRGGSLVHGSKSAKAPVKAAAHRAAVEMLEERRLLTTIVVTGTGDAMADDGFLTLREAVAVANGLTNSDEPDRIEFNIADSGPHTIVLGSGLTVTDAVVIDGYTQSGASRNTEAEGTDAVLKIEVVGPDSENGTNSALLTLGTGAGGSTVTGIAFGSNYEGLLIEGDDNRIVGNYFGLNAAGTTGRDFVFTAVNVHGDDNTIGGSDPGDRNVIANAREGVFLFYNDGTTILNNYIGTDATGTVAMGNTDGVFVRSATHSTIGGSTEGTGNLISGNDRGVQILDSTTNTVQGNRIGTDASGDEALGNRLGVLISGNSSYNLIGGTVRTGSNVEGNIIAHNTISGVLVNKRFGTPVRNAILSNVIYDNGGAGIDLSDEDTDDALLEGDGPTPNDEGDGDEGTNGLTNFPVLTGAYFNSASETTYITGTLNGLPNETYYLEFFLNASDDAAPEARSVVVDTFVTTDNDGNATFGVEAFGLPETTGQQITATASRTESSVPTETSEISASLRVTELSGVAFSVDTQGVTEVTEGNSGTKTVRFYIRISGGYPAPVGIGYGTADGTATYPEDFIAVSGGIIFEPGEIVKVIDVPIKGDTKVEGNETFKLEAYYNGQTKSATVTIKNDDVAPSSGKSISGFNWSETDGDGVYEAGQAGESIASGKTIFIDANANGKLDAGEKSTTTNAQGKYTFANLASGQYRIVRVLPAGFRLSKPSAGYQIVNLSGVNITGIDFGSTNKPAPQPPKNNASIAGFLFWDDNHNASFNTGEVKQANKTVFIDTDGDGILDASEKRTTTNAQGTYSFTGLAAGTYKIRRVVPGNTAVTTPPRNIIVAAGQAVSNVLIGSAFR